MVLTEFFNIVFFNRRLFNVFTVYTCKLAPWTSVKRSQSSWVRCSVLSSISLQLGCVTNCLLILLTILASVVIESQKATIRSAPAVMNSSPAGLKMPSWANKHWNKAPAISIQRSGHTGMFSLSGAQRWITGVGSQCTMTAEVYILC